MSLATDPVAAGAGVDALPFGNARGWRRAIAAGRRAGAAGLSSVTKLRFGNIDNLFAERGPKRGEAGPNLCFAGHTDVVPTGPTEKWRYDPFGGIVEDGILYGRGACDMKGAIAAFIAATQCPARLAGRISLLITGDEEGDATEGHGQAAGMGGEKRQNPGFLHRRRADQQGSRSAIPSKSAGAAP